MHTALRSNTDWGSRQMFLENIIGSLEVGKKADVAIWTATATSTCVPTDRSKT